MWHAIPYLVSLIVGGTGAWIIKNYGEKIGILDKPEQRSSHSKVTPKGAGVGILAAFVIVSLVRTIPKSFWVPAALLSLFSFWGDRFDVPPKIRLLFQFTASVILLKGILGGNQSQLSGYLLILPLAVFVVGTANFYNFMDGINGIAAITGIIGFGLLACFAMISNTESPFTPLAISLALACLGFLPFNFPEAHVFMGDVGSILLGFVFASMVIWLSNNFLDFVCLAAFLFPFYADELTTMVVRLKEGEKLTRPHRRHLYQLLANEFGISHWKVSVGYGVVQLVIGISVLLLRNFGILVVFLLLVGYFSGFIVTTWAVRTRLRTVRR